MILAVNSWRAATCVPTDTDPGSCSGAVTCNQAAPQCPVNTTAGIKNGCYTGFCIPNAQCNAQNPGQCYATVTCASAAPQCPSGTLPVYWRGKTARVGATVSTSVGEAKLSGGVEVSRSVADALDGRNLFPGGGRSFGRTLCRA